MTELDFSGGPIWPTLPTRNRGSGGYGGIGGVGQPDPADGSGSSGGYGGIGGATWTTPHYFIRPAPPAGIPNGLQATLIGDIATDIQTRWGVPALLSTTIAVGTISAATRGRTTVTIPNGGQFPLAIYLAALAAPGAMKSPVLSALAEPLLTLQQELIGQTMPDVRLAESKMEALRAAIKSKQTDLAKQLAKGADNVTISEIEINIQGLQTNLADLEDHGVTDRHDIIVTGADLTYEALINRAHRTGGKIALLGAEGTLIENLAGRYSDGAARTEFLNSAYDQEPYSSERVGNGERVLKQPWATLVLTVQPDVMTTMLRNDHMRRRGFLQRFWQFNIPTVAYRNRHDMPSGDSPAASEWARRLGRIWTSDVAVMECSTAAEPLREIENDLINPAANAAAQSGDFLLSGWLGKAAMTGVRIGALIQLLDNPDSGQISRASATAAADLTEVALQHQRFLFADGRAAVETSPRYRVLHWLCTEMDPANTAITATTPEMDPANTATTPEQAGDFSTRDVWRRFQDQTWCERAEDVKAVLTDLESLGWVQSVGRLTGPKGGRPSELWLLHPEAGGHLEAMKNGASA